MKKFRVSHRQELEALYDSYNDDFLLYSSEQELTDLARAVLMEEIARRGLESGLSRLPRQPESPPTQNRLEVWAGGTLEEAVVAMHSLSIANIDVLLIQSPGRPPRKSFLLTVVPAQAEEAMQVLSETAQGQTAEHLLNDFLEAKVTLPQCRECGSERVVFETAKEGNCWSCEACSYTWEEVPSEGGKEPPSALTLKQAGGTSAPGNSSVQTRRRLLNFSVVVLVVVTSALLIAETAPSRGGNLHLIGFFLWTVGVLTWALARWQLGASFTARAEARQLVTSGMFARVQNPIYLSGAITITGIILYFQKPWCLLFLCVLIPKQISRIRKERVVLTEAFGDEYTDYQKKTWF